MNGFNKITVHFAWVICMPMVIMLSSCSSSDPGYARWRSRPQVGDAGPGAVTALGTTPVGMPPVEAEEESFETVAPEPTPIAVSEPAVVENPGPVESTIPEPLVVASPEPALVKDKPKASKKKSGMFGWLGRKKSGKTKTVSYVPFSGGVPESHIVVEEKTEPVVAVAPEPSVIKRRAKVEKKKPSGDFQGWLNSRNR